MTALAAPPAWDEANRVSADRRGDQWAALRVLWRVSALDRVRKCRRFVTGPAAAIGRRGHRAHYSGLQTCGSVWACPCCSAKIQAERTDELVWAVNEAHRRGLRVAMVTVTMRHGPRHDLGHMWDALSNAWAAVTNTDRAVRVARAAVGVHGWVRRVECTHGVNGWHLHAHALLFYEGGDLDRLTAAMWSAWLRRLQAHGLDADREHGLDVRELDVATARAEVAGYLNKSTYERASVAHELAGQLGKSGRRGNRTPFDLLSDLVQRGEAADLALWREWERTSKGRRALTWSKGLRDELLVGQEMSDEELAAVNDGDQVDVVAIPPDTWALIIARRLELRFLEAVEAVDVEDSTDAALAFADAHGLTVWRPPDVLDH